MKKVINRTSPLCNEFLDLSTDHQWFLISHKNNQAFDFF